jgi:hypothetical protein
MVNSEKWSCGVFWKIWWQCDVMNSELERKFGELNIQTSNGLT